MADIRINALANTASTTASDDFLAVDGTTNGTRKLNAYSPTFGGNFQANGTGTIGGNLTVSGSGTNKFGGGSNDLIAIEPDVAGSGAYVSAKNAAASDYEPLTLIGETVTLKYRTGVNSSASGLTLTSTATTLAGNLTVSGTTGVTASDLIIGSSGPSAKSSIAARAARQGLVFDGTAGATVSGSGITLGSTNYTCAFWVNQSSYTGAENRVIGSDGNGAFEVQLNRSANGDISVIKSNTLVVFTTSALLVNGKWQFVAITKSGTSATVYVNGVSSASATDSQTYTGASTVINSILGTRTMPGALVGPYIYNRALSAAEVVALYEAGVPAGADYNSASNTAINTGAVANSSNVNFDYDTFTGASATGFTASVTSSANGSFATVNGAEYSVVTGTRYLVTFSATLTSGTAPKVSFGSSIVGTLSSNIHTVTAGSNSVILTLTATGSRPLYFYNAAGESASFAISSLSVTRLGLLLAPDAGQAGGGLTWYDTSGNSANITLPASGVTWNVPFAGYLTAPASTNLTLNGGSSGASVVLGQGVNSGFTFSPKGTGTVSISGSTQYRAFQLSTSDTSLSAIELSNTSNASPTIWRIGVSGSSGYSGGAANSFSLTTGTTGTIFNLTTGGNALFGTTTDSGNGRIQLATHTTSAGGIGLGTDTSLYRKDANNVGLVGSGKTMFLYQDANSIGLSSTASFGGAASGIIFNDTSKTITVYSGGSTFLSADSSQNATFAGTTLKVSPSANDAAVSIVGRATGTNQAAATSRGATLTVTNLNNTDNNCEAISFQNSNELAIGSIVAQNVSHSGRTGKLYFNISNGAAPAEAFNIAADKTATFAGAIAIGNTVAAAASVASTHKVTISIGGVTYYLLASNV